MRTTCGTPRTDHIARIELDQPAARSIKSTMAHYGWTRTFVFERLAAGELQGVKAGRRTTITSASAQRLFERLPRARYRNASAGMAV